MWKSLLEFLAVLKYALEIIEKNQDVQKLKAQHKLSLYAALKRAKTEAAAAHEEVKKEGLAAVVSDTDAMLK